VRVTVFIVGAGASYEAGGPLRSTFLDRARDLFAAGAVADRKSDFERVFNALVRLRDVFYKSGLDLDNIESVFGAIEMARTIDKLGDYSTKGIVALAKSIRVLIVRTLDESIRCSHQHNPSNPSQDKFLPSSGYGEFVKRIEKINERSACESACSLLTFNYDIALDYALMRTRIPHEYCLESPIDRNVLRLLKLHGSLNWATCTKCKRIRGAQLSEEKVLKYANRVGQSVFPLPTAEVFAEANCGKCGTPLTNDPVIVPPTWNKIEGRNELANVWKQSATELGRAENIICIGYSLPESDLFFRYLFALGTVGAAHLRRFWVFDPDPEGVVEERYRRLIGKGIERRFKFFNGSSGIFSSAVARKGELQQALMQ
jgi:hypothetical protein